eukprot:356994-Chlamydomonas_euryale.AAC.3
MQPKAESAKLATRGALLHGTLNRCIVHALGRHPRAMPPHTRVAAQLPVAPPQHPALQPQTLRRLRVQPPSNPKP